MGEVVLASLSDNISVKFVLYIFTILIFKYLKWNFELLNYRYSILINMPEPRLSS